jgi:uncharacterized protein (TIGR03067 family)
MHRLLCLAVVLATLPASADEKKPATAAALKGKWEVTAAKFNGADSESLTGRFLVFDQGEFTTYQGDTKGRTVRFTVDPKADPKKIDLTAGSEDKKAAGIYAVTKDELKLCYGEPGADRPGKFESAAGSRVFLLILKRVTD